MKNQKERIRELYHMAENLLRQARKDNLEGTIHFYLGQMKAYQDALQAITGWTLGRIEDYLKEE